jgi:hypothetical protein
MVHLQGVDRPSKFVPIAVAPQWVKTFTPSFDAHAFGSPRRAESMACSNDCVGPLQSLGDIEGDH